jgi:hypothetical protein
MLPMKERHTMKPAIVQVLPGEKGTWRVMINFIQHGASYQSKQIADREATRVKEQNLIVH